MDQNVVQHDKQGRSAAAALPKSGWPVRALVRDLTSTQSAALRDAGAELFVGTFDDVGAIRTALKDAYGVFGVQPSSPGGTVTDDDEVRYGKTIAKVAADEGVKHLVYSSGGAAGDKPTGVAHCETKAQIKRHIRTLPIIYTFFMHPDRPMEAPAGQDIGKIFAAIFADPTRFGGKTFEIASDVVTEKELQALFSEATGRQIPYSRFSEEVLAANPFLQKLTALVDDGRLSGNADLVTLGQINPEMLSLKSWLRGPGGAAFEQALGAGGAWAFNR